MKIRNEEISAKRQKKENVILFAGATSFLGSRLAIQYLKNGHHVIFLVRSKDNESPRERLDKLFRVWDYDQLDSARVTILESQLDEPKLGLKDEDYRYVVEQTDEIIHGAANTAMEEEKRYEVQHFNIEGTKNLLQVAIEGKAYFFHFMSTCYSCGTRGGTIHEDYVPHTEFYNPYEESKHIAEKNIIEQCSKFGIRYHIIRPSIVFGDSKTGKATRFNAFYYFVRTLDYLKNIYEKDYDKNGIRSKEIGIYRTPEGKLYIPLRIEIKKGSFFNIIPIDYFIKASKAILEDSLDGGIFHVTNPTPTYLQKTLENFCKLHNIEGLQAITEEEFKQKEPNVIEKLYQEYMDIYRPYFRDTRIFNIDNTLSYTSPKGIEIGQLSNEEVFNRCVEFATKVKYGKLLDSYVEKSQLI